MSEGAGRLVRGLTGGGAVRLLAVTLPNVADEARRAHGLGPNASTLAAEGMVATALMSAYLEGDERIGVQMQASRPRAAFSGEVDAEGNLRARLTPGEIPDTGGTRDGIVLVIKSEGPREVYRGHTEMTGQTFEQALAHHLETSTQVDAIVRIAARVGPDGVEEAFGLLVERLPEDPRAASMTTEAFRHRYGHLAHAPSGELLVELAFGKLAGSPVDIREARPLRWRCRCGVEKVEAMLGSLGADTLREMIGEGGTAVTCEFCQSRYEVGPPRLQALLDLYESGG